jgi:hypothetical protein
MVFRRSRLAWFYYYGHWPKNHIDHINGDKHNDRIANLRDVDGRTNNSNLEKHRNGKLVGATYNIKGPKGRFWASRIKTKGVETHLGFYATQQEAHEAYNKALANL